MNGLPAFVPAEPIRQLVRAHLDADARAHVERPFERLAMEAGIPERSIRALFEGKQRLTLRVADALVTAIDPGAWHTDLAGILDEAA